MAEKTEKRLALAQLSSGPDRDANLERAVAAMSEAARRGSNVVVFPEIVLDRFFPAKHCAVGERPSDRAERIPGPICDAVSRAARELELVTIFNLFEVDAQGRCFDSSPVFEADGSLLGVTRMLHITDYPGFHEQDYYYPGDSGAPVYRTSVGRIGVAICYDRHYPEYMRALGLAGAELVVIPQAGTIGEWPDGLYQAEVRTAAFQNGYYAALCNRVGVEETLTFAGESFVVDPDGRVVAEGAELEDDLVIVDIDLSRCAESHARKLFFRDRRPELYGPWFEEGEG